MSYNDITNKLQATLAGIEGIGNVHRQQYFTKTDEAFYNLFAYNLPDNRQRLEKQKADIRGCMITREGFADEQSANTTNTVVHRIKILVLRSVIGDQDSELDFNRIIDAIAAAFRPQGDLGSLVELTQPIQAERIDYRMFGGYLCHYAELLLLVQEYYTS